MKQSAVEFLHSEYKRILGDTLVDIQKVFAISDSFAKAKEMEKQNVVDAYVFANGDLIEHSKPMAEQYYDKNIKVKKTLIKVLVKYMVYQDAPHPLLDGEWVEKSKVIEVSDLTKVNEMFENISDVKILK